ncbi:MAG: hypothetical protein ACC628_02805 [Pirellulaceae bacterium]
MDGFRLWASVLAGHLPPPFLFKSQTSAFRHHRNKRIAHSDLQYAISTTDHLPAFSHESIEYALQTIRDLMNLINVHYRYGETHLLREQVWGAMGFHLRSPHESSLPSRR